MTRPSPAPDERMVATASLGETLAALRVLSDEAVRPMRQSLELHGQLTALSTYRAEDDTLQVIDGFTRLRAARALGWGELRVRVLPIDVVAATAALATLNRGHALTELEEAWLCRALYRQHKLTQPEIGRLLGHDKSWVCRRLTLAEGLHEQVQADVRLGLVGPRVASELGRLPCGNQPTAAAVAQRRGLTVAQAARMVQTVLALPDAEARGRWLADALAERAPILRAAPAPRAKTEADLFLGDIESVTRIASRLQVRLRDKPLDAFEPAVTALLTEAMGASAPVLTHLSASIARALAGRDLRDAVVE
jgi:ParB-like chromosome segregation protein Spo0J